MTAQHLSSTGRAGSAPNKPLPEAGDEYTFRAPRADQLVVCPYCDDESLTRCDWCGDEGHIFADEFFGAEQ